MFCRTPIANDIYRKEMEKRARWYIEHHSLRYHDVAPPGKIYELDQSLGHAATPENVADMLSDFGDFPADFDQKHVDVQRMVCYLLACEVV